MDILDECDVCDDDNHYRGASCSKRNTPSSPDKKAEEALLSNHPMALDRKPHHPASLGRKPDHPAALDRKGELLPDVDDGPLVVDMLERARAVARLFTKTL